LIVFIKTVGERFYILPAPNSLGVVEDSQSMFWNTFEPLIGSMPDKSTRGVVSKLSPAELGISLSHTSTTGTLGYRLKTA